MENLSSAAASTVSPRSLADSARRWRSVIEPTVFVSDIGIDARNRRQRRALAARLTGDMAEAAALNSFAMPSVGWAMQG